jgi:diguanylate cyclase (GGDEF)-like protein
MRLSEFVEGNSWDLILQNIRSHVGGAPPAAQRISIRKRGGQLFPIKLTTSLVFENGIPVAVQAFGHNFAPNFFETSRQADTKFSGQTTDLAKFTENLRQIHQLSTSAYTSLDQVFSDYLKAGCEIFRLDSGFIFQAENGYGVLRAVRGVGFALTPGDRIDLATLGRLSPVERLPHESRSKRAQVPRSCTKPSISAPIFAEPESYGTLYFYSDFPAGPREFSKYEIDIIELMARDMGRLILENDIRAERKSAKLLEKSRSRLLDVVASNQPLEETLAELAGIVEARFAGALCTVLLWQGGAWRAAGSRKAKARLVEVLTPLLRGLPDPAGGDQVLREHLGALIYSNFIFLDSTAIVSASGTLLGAIVLHKTSDSLAPDLDLEVLKMAAQFASLAAERRQLTDQIEFQAQHDFLTGLPNRFRLLELLEEKLAGAKRDNAPLAVLHIDLDRFKQVNDTLGHVVGDRLLTEVADRLAKNRPNPADIVARTGGDEFTMILSAPADEDQVLRSARQILIALRAPYTYEGRELFVTASIGLSLFPRDGSDATGLVRAADIAMYRAKVEGKNRLDRFVAEGGQGAVERLDLENSLRRALEKSELELYFQPIVTIQGDLDGLEVLLAWHHGKRGRISAKDFIPLAEETGLIVPIGSWVLHQACHQAATWVRQGLPATRISVNVSALQFAHPDFAETVAAALGAAQLPPQSLELELTESIILRDMEASLHSMARLRDLGVGLSIDDFGTGYSSLNYLSRLPVQRLKIDQSFLRDVKSGSLAVVQTIVSLARRMNLSVVAEGVETAEELELLRAAGCDRVQGYLYGQSLRQAEVAKLLARTDGKVPVKER